MSSKSSIKHVAIIMDGNGRWAKNRAHSRVWGHIRGATVVANIVKESIQQDIEALTLYAFSTENWSRPYIEVVTLFKILKKFLLKERSKIYEKNVRFRVMGELNGLPDSTVNLVNEIEAKTRNNKGMKLTFAFGYGARKEIISSVNKFIEENPGRAIEEADLVNNLFVNDLGDVDLLIRTGGDQRISNFLLWQIAYAELYFTPTKWPEFSAEEFRSIIYDVRGRERRFGTIDHCKSLQDSSQLAKQNKSTLLHDQR